MAWVSGGCRSPELFLPIWSVGSTCGAVACSQAVFLAFRSSNAGYQGVWVFEIGSPATAKGVVPADVNLDLDEEGADYEDEEYDLVTSRLGLEDVATSPFPSHSPRREHTNPHGAPRVLSPSYEATERPHGIPSERTRSFQLPVERFPQQHPQVIDVDEVEETGIGKTSVLRFGTFLACLGF